MPEQLEIWFVHHEYDNGRDCYAYSFEEAAYRGAACPVIFNLDVIREAEVGERICQQFIEQNYQEVLSIWEDHLLNYD